MGRRPSANCSLTCRTFSESFRFIHSFSGLSSELSLLLSSLPPPMDDMCKEDDEGVFAMRMSGWQRRDGMRLLTTNASVVENVPMLLPVAKFVADRRSMVTVTATTCTKKASNPGYRHCPRLRIIISKNTRSRPD